MLAPADEVRSKVSPTSGTVTQPIDERSCRFECGADSLYPLAFHIAWLGFDFEVVEPPELKDALQRLGQRIVDRAGA